LRANPPPPRRPAGATPLAHTTAPIIPAGLSATAISATEVELSWSASTDDVGVTGYTVYRDGVEVAAVSGATSYADTGLSPATAYSYTVAAFDAAGNSSAQSEPAGATTPDTQAPTVPTGLVASAVSPTPGHLFWSAPSGNVCGTGYTVYRDGVAVAPVTSGTSYADTGLSPATAYSYTVQA